VAHSPRGWTGARTPSGKKRVRQAERRAAINGPRTSKAKTLVSKTLKIATGQLEGDATASLAEAFSALDRAAKAGAIHPNAAARRKSRLARNVTAALGGAAVQAGAKSTKTIGTAAAAKAAKARIAAGKAVKAKGAQTAAGKARAALAKAGRTDVEAVKPATAPVVAEAPTPKARTTRAKAPAVPAAGEPAAKAPAKKAPAKPAAKAPAKKAPAKPAAKAPAAPAAVKPAAKAPAKKAPATKAE
jgi:ribosomal protein S20